MRFVAILALFVALIAGCRYSAALGDCDVRLCQGPANCPDDFTCDGEGFCRSPGATQSCAAVIGDANKATVEVRGEAFNLVPVTRNNVARFTVR